MMIMYNYSTLFLIFLKFLKSFEKAFKCLNFSVMNRDWQPGPYPKTEEERIKAAQKYNMHPDEYVPYPDDDPKGFCKGDYPDLPLIGNAAKDPYYPYDIPEQKRNHNETVSFLDY